MTLPETSTDHNNKDNPSGLKSDLQWDNKTGTGEFVPSKFHEGGKGLVHGGITAYLLDEAMARTVLPENKNITTANLKVRFRHPARIHEPLFITAAITNKRRNLIEAEARISLKDGTLIAEGTSTIYIISKAKKEYR
ncbi:PaaI family thioesterase [Chloroflexota bacterium]